MPRVPASFPVRPIRPGSKAALAAGRNLATCGACGRSWDDGIATGYTPAPGARCPFEAFHADPDAPPPRRKLKPAPVPRLGVARIVLSFSDADGLRAVHGTGGATLLHVPPERLRADDWRRVWQTLRLIEAEATTRTPLPLA